MAVIVTFFVAHWLLSVFAQTFFLHRYSAHRMFTMSKFWERFFYAFTWLTQGSSFLVPRAYAIMHREHHAYSDTDKDPHSPHTYPNFFKMMWHTKGHYQALVHRRYQAESKFEGGYPEWPLIDRIGDNWMVRVAFGVAYTLVYLKFAPSPVWFLLLPFHYLMGPTHGAIVNWGGHKYGYRNFNTPDKSVNSLPFDFLTFGELFQNNHHKFGMAPNFAMRKWELDPTWQAIKVLNAIGIISLPDKVQVGRIGDMADEAEVPAAPAE